MLNNDFARAAEQIDAAHVPNGAARRWRRGCGPQLVELATTTVVSFVLCHRARSPNISRWEYRLIWLTKSLPRRGRQWMGWEDHAPNPLRSSCTRLARCVGHHCHRSGRFVWGVITERAAALVGASLLCHAGLVRAIHFPRIIPNFYARVRRGGEENVCTGRRLSVVLAIDQVGCRDMVRSLGNSSGSLS
jgi:hypothetical protein